MPEGLFDLAAAGDDLAADSATHSAADRPGVDPHAPLAVRMRPRSLDEVVGQRHLLGPGTPLRTLVEGGGTTSLLLWGPPGTGKTTLAHVVSTATGRRYRELSAVTAGVKDVRAVIEEARQAQSRGGIRTVLFLDEVHRFSKTQQDALLPAVENAWVTLVAATTENPFFSVVAPLLSRSLLLTLEPLGEADVREVVRRALADPRGYGGRLDVELDALDHLVRLAGGDARRALTALEAGAGAVGGHGTLTLAVLETAVDRAAVRYDRDGDQHYDVVSGFIKSMRGGDVDAALHYLARMLEAGEDPRFVARRIVVLASEDIGMADPTALQVAVAAAQALEMIGLPEARLNLAQAVIHCALAPKSNAVIAALDSAVADIRAGRIGRVPAHLRDGHYPGAKKLGHAKGYRYPHDYPGGVVRQQYAPDAVDGRRYYLPSGHGAEAAAGERLAGLQRVLRGGNPDDRTLATGQDGGHAASPSPGPTPSPELSEGPVRVADGFRPRCRPAVPTDRERAALGGFSTDGDDAVAQAVPEPAGLPTPEGT